MTSVASFTSQSIESLPRQTCLDRAIQISQSLKCVIEAVGKIGIAICSYLGYLFSCTFWQSAYQYSLSEKEGAGACLTQGYHLFAQAFGYEKEVDESTDPTPLQQAPPLAERVVPLTAEERENRIRQGAELIQRKLRTELEAAEDQKNSELDKAFSHSEFHVIPERATEPRLQGAFLSSVCHFIGRRRTMEDTHLNAKVDLTICGQTHEMHLFGIFDGHGGASAAEYLKEHLSAQVAETLLEMNQSGLTDVGIWNALKMAFVKLNRIYEGRAGSTATLAVVLDNKLWVANLGDSRTILVKETGSVMQLSEDAKPADPRYLRGIQNRGGWVRMGRTPRVQGRLAVARAFGDHALEPFVSSRPKITMVPLSEIPRGSHIVLACDGVYDVASTRQIGNFIHENRNTSLQQMAEGIVNSSYVAGSRDNLSAMVVRLV